MKIKLKNVHAGKQLNGTRQQITRFHTKVHKSNGKTNVHRRSPETGYERSAKKNEVACTGTFMKLTKAAYLVPLWPDC